MMRAAMTAEGIGAFSMRRRWTNLAIMPIMGMSAIHCTARRMRAYLTLKEAAILKEEDVFNEMTVQRLMRGNEQGDGGKDERARKVELMSEECDEEENNSIHVTEITNLSIPVCSKTRASMRQSYPQ